MQKGKALAALAVFIFVNVMLVFTEHNITRYGKGIEPWSPNKSRAWWALKSFSNWPQDHDIVLMGSSLMMCATDCADALAFNSQESCSWAHPCRYLTHTLQKCTAQFFNNFCFALPGQTPSEAWCIAKNVYRKETIPAAIIYGINPADFVSCTLLGPTRTEVYKLMHRVGDCSDVEFDDIKTFWERFNYEIEHKVWLYRHRSDALYLVRSFVDNIQANILHQDLMRSALPIVFQLQFLKVLPEQYFPNDPVLKIETAEQAENVRKIINGEPVPLFSSPQKAVAEATKTLLPSKLPNSPPQMAKYTGTAQKSSTNEHYVQTANQNSVDNSHEMQAALARYSFIYSKLNERTYKEELNCFNKLTQYCKEHNIALFVVNMPLAIEHVSLIPRSTYTRYLSDVKDIAKGNGAVLIDLQIPSEFPTSMFLDSNHLNPEGSIKFWNMLIPKIAPRMRLCKSNSQTANYAQSNFTSSKSPLFWQYHHNANQQFNFITVQNYLD